MRNLNESWFEAFMVRSPERSSEDDALPQSHQFRARRRFLSTGGSTLALLASLLAVGSVSAQEAPAERPVRIIEGTVPYIPGAEGPVRHRMKQPATTAPMEPVASPGAVASPTPVPSETKGFDDMVSKAIAAERRKYPGPGATSSKPSAWKPSRTEELEQAPATKAPVPEPEQQILRIPEPAVTAAPSSAPRPLTPDEPYIPSSETTPSGEQPPKASPPKKVSQPKVPQPYKPPVVVERPVADEPSEPVKAVPPPRKRKAPAPAPEPVEAQRPKYDDPDTETSDLDSDATSETAAGIIISDVTIRSEPVKTSAAVGTVKAGQHVEVLECTGWCQIRIGETTGWIYGTFIDLPDAITPGGRP